MGDAEHLTLPIEVLQAQGRDFPGAEAIDRQQHQQGAIADVGEAVPLGRGKETASRRPRTSPRGRPSWAKTRGAMIAAAEPVCGTSRAPRRIGRTTEGDA